MAQFKYLVSLKGEEEAGVLEADSLAEAAEKLTEQGGYILKLVPRFSLGPARVRQWLEEAMAAGEGMKASEKILFTTQLGSMLKTGLPIIEAIEVFVEEKGGGSSALLRQIMEQLKSGKKLSRALERYAKVFDRAYVNVVRSGETMGTLAESLEYLGDQMRREHELKVKVRSAMIYPLVVVIAMAAVMTFILLSVVPKIVIFAENSGAQLPRITAIMVAATGWLNKFWWLALLAVTFVGGLVWRLTKTKEGKKFFAGLVLKLPVLGSLVARYNQVRFARLLAGFYAHGISVESAFEILSESLTNYYYSEACLRLKQKLVMGRSLSEALESEKKLFPPIMSRVVKGAERTGDLDKTLTRLSTYYEQELETALKNLTTIIEPVLIVLLGVGVIGIALAVIVPIYRVTTQLK
ncbi:MAG: Type II secretion system protein [Candidatus Beckwithbacteria bacterium GW2011_GWB1_47_15]|uniref:Type II secretion system protein n=1 Tax=Candidatus Beckwithbacteria bacterium GW2011_GWB1_47_15 TaxID=1618371 RepID=A0A0G1UU67_9BACT|nr:MAG: type II secretion system F domain, type IV pilus assembly protein PilC [Candidatus Beckwithbacteria bacterium GW2011_GWC1_49_16]KKU34995.1 MAG: Type II secretion system protein [Candidatus Beckwithbacteria bacterium GW2011_GWA1_46_30]KKU61260.1 MAG: Type II secretion system protein [Candidatus Beckwithbacteria bacterium GW2011_GWB1_47_15]KKU71446.1 MAG: Type II secretion system protein [Candidatus Beckwithbacteria bacterium GW2011_GWA2_47_25]KKW03066.1 MAG: Type II secretion system prot